MARNLNDKGEEPMQTSHLNGYLRLAAILLMLSAGTIQAGDVAYSEVDALLGPPVQLQQLRALGPDILPFMAAIYSTAETRRKATIAMTFYNLGWQSEDAHVALMQDIHTDNDALRLQVQWALGRVSGKSEVVDTLLDIMRNDRKPLYRDKAACALASDQIHLSETQKVDLYAGLIDGLSDSKTQVRDISIKALQIHTGQTRGYRATAGEQERNRSIAAWRRWLGEYRENL
jgi:hypothetical protein